MAKFHINPETQEVGRCRAKVHCDFADSETGQEPIHFPSREEANAYVEKKLAEEMEETPSSVSSRKRKVKKKPRTYFNTIHPIRKGEALYGADNLPELEEKFKKYYSFGKNNHFKNAPEVIMNDKTGTKHRFAPASQRSFYLDDTFSNRALAEQYFSTIEKTRIINKTGKPLYVCAFTRRRSVVTAPQDTYAIEFNYTEQDKFDPGIERVFKIVDKKPRFLRKTDIIVQVDPE